MRKNSVSQDDIKLDRYYGLFETTYDKMEEDMLHKKYKRLALKLHPDKGGSHAEFQDLQEGFETLLIMCKIRNENKIEGHGMLGNVLQYVALFQRKYKEPIEKVFELITNRFGNFSQQYLDTLDIQTLYRIHVFTTQCTSSTFIPSELLANIENAITKKHNRKTITTKATFVDMMEKNVYKFEFRDETFFAPMWHSEVEFETTSGEEFVLQFLPTLPPNMWLDENNNVCVFHKMSFDKTMLYNEFVEIAIDQYTFRMPCEEIVCKKSQTILLKGIGIWKIDENEMFNTTERTHVIVYLDLE